MALRKPCWMQSPVTKSVEDWRTLGYLPDAPVLCGVRSVHSGSRLGEASGKGVLDQSADFPSWLAPSMSSRFDRCNPLKKSIFHIISWILVDREAFDLDDKSAGLELGLKPLDAENASSANADRQRLL